MTKNPLLQQSLPFKFGKILPKHFKPAITNAIKDNQKLIKKLLLQKNPTWSNFVAPLDESSENLSRIWSIISHLNRINGTKEIRSAYENCLPLITKYASELSQHSGIYQAIDKISHSKEYQQLDGIQKKIIEDKLRDFKLAGVALSKKNKITFTNLQQKLAELNNKFAYNVLDSSQNYSINLNEQEISGIPTNILTVGRNNAIQKKQQGWTFTLDLPSYQAVITYADSRQIREKIFKAYATRASAINPFFKKWDNTPIIQKILKIRDKASKLLKFENYAEYSLASKMAPSTNQVLKFLNQLAKKSLPQAKKEFKALVKLAKKDGIKNFKPWDLAYYEEKLRQKDFGISQEELRPYFPANQAIKGVFDIANRLFGIKIKEKTKVPTWHPDVRFFEIYDSKNNLQGGFYTDLYFRENKQGGAWMDNCQTRYLRKNSTVQIPIAFLVCNFSPSTENTSALLTHDDVITLLHEFGHCLQHLLTKVNHISASGVNGVPWDAVELASQFMENWGWGKEGLKLLSKHYKSGKTLPANLLKKLINSYTYNAGLHMLRQLEFALIDFDIHLASPPPNSKQIKQITKKVQQITRITPTYQLAQFCNSFSHIFAGAYSAGYYSYKWAEVLSADAFSKFQETGIFNQKTGKEFLRSILETGGSKDPMELFEQFRGRPPKIDALLKQNGIIKNK